MGTRRVILVFNMSIRFLEDVNLCDALFKRSTRLCSSSGTLNRPRYGSVETFKLDVERLNT